jgi:hypothetical protein
MIIEDLDNAEQAIEARDGGQLWESDYYQDAKRWISEAYALQSEKGCNEHLFSRCLEVSEELRQAVFENCANHMQNADAIEEAANELSDCTCNLTAEYGREYYVVVRLELAQAVAEKAIKYDWSIN